MRGIAILALMCAAVPAASEEKAELPLLVSEDFENGMDRWEFTDPAAWALTEDEGGTVLELKVDSAYLPPVRSPKSIARIKEVTASDFTFDVKMRQTGREYGHRDLCLFFGYQDPSHFYYVHLASKADEHANSIFLVNGAPRVSIAKDRTDGTAWDDAYHQVRVVRDSETGRIEVYFDDMTKPAMIAEDKTLPHGAFGVGSFDDTGRFDNVIIRGKAHPKE